MASQARANTAPTADHAGCSPRPSRPAGTCASNGETGPPISSSKSTWGGARDNAGGARANAGGVRANSGGIRPGAGRKPQAPAPIPPDVARWHCLRTVPQGELTADIEIRLAGFTLFMPTMWKPAIPSRRAASGGAMLAGKPDRIVPLFPRYLFVQFRRTDNWPDIRELPGVDRFLCATSGLPAIVPDSAIEALRSVLAPNGCLYPPNRRGAPIPVGATTRVTQGPLIDVPGLCAASDGKRVRFLMEFMGRQVLVTAKQAKVEAA